MLKCKLLYNIIHANEQEKNKQTNKQIQYNWRDDGLLATLVAFS